MIYTIDKIQKCFPFETFRPYQHEVLEDVVNAFNSGVEVYLLNGPVGFGKSPCGVAMGRMTDLIGTKGPEQPFGCYYLSPQNLLVEQLGNEKAFSPFIKIIKGRDHYGPCMAHKFQDKTCKFGKCQVDDSYECEDECNYKAARNAAKVAQITVSNFVYMIVVSDYLFGERDLLIVDECHSVPDWGLNFVTCTIWSRDLGIPIAEFKTFDEYIDWLSKVSGKFTNDLKVVIQQMREADKEGEIVLGLKERRDKLQEIIDKIDRLLGDYDEHKEEWVWTIVDKGTNKERIQFQPVTAGRFLEDVIWWRGQKKLLMSGTIFPELFVEEAGLIDKICEFKDIPSTFPVENRPIYYWPVGKMSLDNREVTIPKLIDRSAVIMKRNIDKKGFMHCGSYDIAKKIYDGLSRLPSDMLPEGGIWIQDRDDREGSLREWMESTEPSLFESVNMTEGVDLKGKLCEYQINAKVQFPYLGDKRVKARMEMKRYACQSCGKFYRTNKDMTTVTCTCGGKFILNMDVHIYTCQVCNRKLVTSKVLDKCGCGGTLTKQTVVVDGSYWYDAQAIIDLVQSYGRSNRSETDVSEYWLLDESFGRLYKRRYTVFPKMFKEAVKVVK